MTNPWDNNAAKRHKQILDGRDFSFDNVLLPTFTKLITSIKSIGTYKVLDVGCGSGILTYQLSKHVRSITGIDPSKKSVDIAKQAYEEVNKINFDCTSIENFSSKDKFDVVISNMSIQTIKNVRRALSSTLGLMNDSGVFIFSIPHPCFWIEYRKKLDSMSTRIIVITKTQHIKLLFQ